MGRGRVGQPRRPTTLSERLAPLAERNLDAYREAVAMLGGAESGGDESLRDALERAAGVPLEIAEVAVDVAALAAVVAERGDQAMRADAVSAALLAEAAARAAATLVEVNLGTTSSDERVARARDLAGSATAPPAQRGTPHARYLEPIRGKIPPRPRSSGGRRSRRLRRLGGGHSGLHRRLTTSRQELHRGARQAELPGPSTFPLGARLQSFRAAGRSTPVARQVVVIVATTRDMGVFDGLQALELFKQLRTKNWPLTVTRSRAFPFPHHDGPGWIGARGRLLLSCLATLSAMR